MSNKKSIFDLATKPKQADQDISINSINSNNFSLRNSGIRKREFERSERAYEREIAKSEKFLEDGNAQTVLLKNLGLESEIERRIKQKNIVLDPSQEAAIEGMLANKYACLIGPAGCGKTTIQQIFIDMVIDKVGLIDLTSLRRKFLEGTKRRDKDETEAAEFLSTEAAKIVPSIAYCAPTGKGTEQLKRIISPEYHGACMTVHSLLGYYPEIVWSEKHNKEIQNWRPFYDRNNKLPFDGYVFDECGMFWLRLWNEFIEAYEPRENSFILLIGDINQLPPPMDKSALGFAMRKFSTFELTKIHRQAENSPIIVNAHNILQGRDLVPFPGQFDIISPIKVSANPSQAFVTFLQVITKLYKDGTFKPLRDAIIVPHNVGILGKDALNSHLVNIFNAPQKDEKTGIYLNPRIKINTGSGTAHYAVGDKIMVLENNRDMGLTNGMVGVITAIKRNEAAKMEVEEEGIHDDLELFSDEELDCLEETLEKSFSLQEKEKEKKEKEEELAYRQSSHILFVEFESGANLSISTAGAYNKISLGYAFTCHKSQGGEYKNVFIFLHDKANRGVKREWLYTAVTRAKERVFFMATSKATRNAIKFQNIKGETLEEKIQSFIDHENNADKTQPLWPADA